MTSTGVAAVVLAVVVSVALWATARGLSHRELP